MSANIAALAIFTFAVWRVGSMITPEKIVASCNSPSRVADELNDAVRLVRGATGSDLIATVNYHSSGSL